MRVIKIFICYFFFNTLLFFINPFFFYTNRLSLIL